MKHIWICTLVYPHKWTQLHTLQTHAPHKAFFANKKCTLIIFFKGSVLEKYITKSTATTISSSPAPPLSSTTIPTQPPVLGPVNEFGTRHEFCLIELALNQIRKWLVTPMPLLPLLTSEHSLPGQPLLTAGQDYFSPPVAWTVPSSTAMTASRDGAYRMGPDWCRHSLWHRHVSSWATGSHHQVWRVTKNNGNIL